MCPIAQSSSKTTHRWLSRNFAVILFLVTGVLVSVLTSNRTIEILIATSSTKEKGPKNQTREIRAKNITSWSPEKEDAYNNTSIEAVNDEEAVFYETTWPPLQKALCGEGAPNLALTNLLFRLARSEVFAEDDPRIPLKHRNTSSSLGPSTTQMKFFAGQWGVSVFEGFNERGDPFATIYVKLWKCGNNQIRWMEKKLFKHLNGTYDMMQLSQALYGTHNPCIYTAIRDPISHFLSGYNEVEVRQLGEYNNQSAIDWPSHKPAPYHLSVPYSSNSLELRKQRFRKFVEDVLLEEATFGNHYVYSHFFPMSRILVILKKNHAELTRYIPRLENITSTWAPFLSSNCENFPALETIPTMRLQGQHKSSHDRLGLYKAAKEVWKEGGPTSKSLCLLHAFDYACFEDLPEKIPAICRSVYQDYASRIVEIASKNYFVYRRETKNETQATIMSETIPN